MQWIYFGVHKNEALNIMLALASAHVLQTGLCMPSSLSKHYIHGGIYSA